MVLTLIPGLVMFGKLEWSVVYGQIKAADQKYCQSQRWRRKRKEISFRTRGFRDNLDDFWPRYCGAKVLDFKATFTKTAIKP